MASENNQIPGPFNNPQKGFNFFWSFRAQPKNITDKRKIEGTIQAPSAIYAIARVKRMGFVRPQVQLNIELTVLSGFGWIVAADFDLRDKARLYETIGRRLQRDGSLITALESSLDYLQDGRLKGAVAIMVAQINDGGQQIHEAMQAAGFTVRDAMVVRALSQSGSAFQAFTDLAAEAKARHHRNTALDSAMRMPILMLIGVYLALPAFFLGLGPRIAQFFKRLGAQNANIPDGVKAIYALVDWVNANLSAATVLYAAIGLAGFVLWNSSFWTHVAMRIKAFRELALKAEHASIWSVFSLMYAAGIPAEDICNVLRPTSRLPATSEALRRMSKRLAAGGTDREAIQSAGFPKFVVSGYRSAHESGSLSEGLKSFTSMLNEDIELLTAQTKGWLQLLSLLIMAATVLGVFYIVYYPIAGPILNSL